MATKTPHYDLTKPAYGESADIKVINNNMDIIDQALDDIHTEAQGGGGEDISYEDYMAMPEEEIKQDYNYYIPDFPGAGGGGGKIEYSTEEKEVGTWVDGTPVYRKCYVLEQPVTVFSGGYVQLFDDTGMSKIIRVDIVATDKTIVTGLYNNPSSKGMFANYGVNLALPAGSVIIVEYTKEG